MVPLTAKLPKSMSEYFKELGFVHPNVLWKVLLSNVLHSLIIHFKYENKEDNNIRRNYLISDLVIQDGDSIYLIKS